MEQLEKVSNLLMYLSIGICAISFAFMIYKKIRNHKESKNQELTSKKQESFIERNDKKYLLVSC